MTNSQHLYEVRPRNDRRTTWVSTIFRSVAAILIATLVSLNAETTSDEDAVRKLPQTFCGAWGKHDGHELAKMMAEDVDFVTVATVYLHGRADFEKFHVRLLSGRFKDSTITPLETTIRFLHPEMAVVHWSWRIDGDKAFAGTPRPPRFGMMT